MYMCRTDPGYLSPRSLSYYLLKIILLFITHIKNVDRVSESSISERNTTEGTTIATVEALETSKGSTPGVDTVEVRSTTLDLCSSFEFGCCADDQTEAKGPGGQGCPCNATEHCDFFKGMSSS